MKKLLMISVSALALSAGAAFADNSSTLNQNGDRNQATIDQALSGGATNNSTVYQGVNGNGNASTDGVADIGQIGGNGSILNSYVQQNDAKQNAKVRQNGQKGGQQTSNITQSNSGNHADVTQTTQSGTDNQQSYITQTGKNGSATVNQSGHLDFSSISQTGNDNNPGAFVGTTTFGTVNGGVEVTQSGTATNTSYVNQDSDSSGVKVNQDGLSGTNYSQIAQNAGGNNNTVYSSQSANGFNNTSLVTQSGTFNTAGIKQH